MKGIVISSNCSGGGKTTITLGIMKALMKLGFDVQGYKVGPDYIDPAFHSTITKKPSRNLDLFLMGEEGVKAAFSRGYGDMAVIEGVMGLFDGKGIDSRFSTAHVAKTLELPIILILSPKAASATLAAEIQGLLNYCDEWVKKPNVKGVILNNISSSYYNLLKLIIETHCNIKVYGYIPKDEEISLKSRHLGLIQCSEVEDIEYKINKCSEHILSNVNMDELISTFSEVRKYEDNFHIENKNLKIAVAKDEAFSFYYTENLELLKEAGEIVYFSPLHDKKLPDNIDFLYLGGGYPEVFIKELSNNTPMLKSIKSELNNGLKCYAECGGLMYLTESISTLDGKEFNTVGYFKGKSVMTTRLQNFGYCAINIDEKSPLLKDLSINAHEFHKSKVELDENYIYNLTKNSYDGSIKNWNCGYVKDNTLGAYGHIHFFGNINFLKELLK
ncbi:cobyrinic acid a,c-diamide synthase [Clostridium argentinense CDC 2741]|uniref:Cobyrinate a,c-diamide synthase n=1 Tax=Clostridium argentinense CDC 2741 TaxID=1418104 RepID=A0A0C1R4Y5_9CLOT|nr:cobyrinate a,c-diamide synthase [Clostridium argentinense]ARC84892.1 cobyrinic acid a,c-diamide synthase [Clostridium argentinense]KIE48497.1 cobyrinic acid a,c-diamide synthase [Clostridium argentinense CDC 2741]NFF40730.1 cobyrinate a,c-diamide synthase [Clostridium argentinense]NFP51923.1 cobyrinate a,c-diamide synthase [Clostridium argentinense]NFP74375.1 cobyrinate a,c-diamide synthase [Clostridium argentinense]